MHTRVGLLMFMQKKGLFNMNYFPAEQPFSLVTQISSVITTVLVWRLQTS